MNYDDAERWIVDLIHNARLDAKIDSKMGTVVIGTQHPIMRVNPVFSPASISIKKCMNL